MKNVNLNPADRAIVNSLADLLMTLNARDDANASQSSTYGALSDAISKFVRNQTGVDISNVDWNMGGNRSFGEDIQQAIFAAHERDVEAFMQSELTAGNLTLDVVEDVQGVTRRGFQGSDVELRNVLSRLPKGSNLFAQLHRAIR